MSEFDTAMRGGTFGADVGLQGGAVVAAERITVNGSLVPSSIITARYMSIIPKSGR